MPEGTLHTLSFSNNAYFQDGSVLQLINFMDRQRAIKNKITSLYLDRINCSQTIMFKLCRSVGTFTGLEMLSLSGNHLPYFCVDSLVNTKKLPRVLLLSDTRMDDLSAFHLLSSVLKQKQVRHLDLSKNLMLGFPLY